MELIDTLKALRTDTIVHVLNKYARRFKRVEQWNEPIALLPRKYVY